MRALNTVIKELTAALTRSPTCGLPWAPPADHYTVSTLGAGDSERSGGASAELIVLLEWYW